jgi:hypothetical protein
VALAAHPDIAWRLAVERLAMGWEQFLALSPLELAWQFWGERRRRNHRARMLAWAVSILSSPHVDKKHKSQISMRRLFVSASGGDLDRDELE